MTLILFWLILIWGRKNSLSLHLIFCEGVDGYWGALELALRVSQINLNSNKNKRGKKEHDITVGVNWHVNKNFRMMSNYTVAKATEPNIEKEEIIQLRGQYDF